MPSLTPTEVIRIGIEAGQPAEVIVASLEAAGWKFHPSMAHSSLPAGLRPVRMSDDGRPYFLVLSDRHSEYEAEQERSGCPDFNTKMIMRLLNGGGTLIDIGANIGTVAIPVAMTGTQVWAIEPHPVNFQKLDLAVKLNGLTLRAVRAAVTAVGGTIRIAGEEYWARVDQHSGLEVTAVTIDGLLKSFEAPRPLVIKIDIEGHESHAIKGGTGTIARYRPTILFESVAETSDASETKHLLSSLRYRLFLIRGAILVPRNPDDIQECLVGDFVAIPVERMENVSHIEIRDLLPVERLDWVEQDARGPTETHHRHAANVVLSWAAQGNHDGRDVAKHLLNFAHLHDLHSRLRSLAEVSPASAPA